MIAPLAWHYRWYAVQQAFIDIRAFDIGEVSLGNTA